MDDLGAFFVSTNILDGKDIVKFLVRSDMGIPIANGWQILGEKDDEFELVTIHTIKEVFPQIMDYVNMDMGTKLEAIYEDGNFVKCIEVK